jgi:hypothetical protein
MSRYLRGRGGRGQKRRRRVMNLQKAGSVLQLSDTLLWNFPSSKQLLSD